MRIIPLTEEYLEGVLTLEALCFSESWSRVTYKAILEDPHSTFLVLLEEDTVVGTAGYHWVLEEGNIDNVAVHPSFQGQGYGYHLMNALMEHAKRNGITRMTLEVRESNKAAIALYEKFGFFPVAKRKNYYTKPLEDAVLMDWGTPLV